MDIGETTEVTIINPMVVPQRTRQPKVAPAPVREPVREPELVPAIPRRREA
jgi:hypothetical protein